ncbi:hypothetical protein SYNGFB01_00335 [Synechococcus sp. GFB01]|nr:hypothetical protein SYNGFB01_00335 [Synechococcus sp. GFB01]
MAVGIGQLFSAAALPVGGEPLQHRPEASPSTSPGEVKGPDQGLAEFGPEGGASCRIPGSHRPDPPHRFDAAALAQLRQPAIADQLGPQGRLATDAQLAMPLPQVLGCGQAQHGIAEEFQPLVIVGQPRRTVREGLLDRSQGRCTAAGAVGGGWIDTEAAQKGQQTLAALRGHDGAGWKG